MAATSEARRSDSLYYDNISRRALCNLVAHLETDNVQLKRLVADMLASNDETYRDYHGRARKMVVDLT